nr:DMT family transporter [Granulosicoccus sp.]
SLFNTSVANTVLLLSTGPFFAAMLGWLVLRESIGIGTFLTMLLAMAGVAVMVGGELSQDDLWGMAYAIAAVTAFAVMIVALRYSGPDRDNLAATSLAGLVAAAITLCFVITLDIGLWDLLMAIALGTVQVGVGFILITLATRSVPSAQVPLFALAETALAPLWVWWIIDEVPSRSTLIGGGVVLLAVTLKGIDGIRQPAIKQ